MTQRSVNLRLDYAEETHDLLSAFSQLLRDSFPQRLIDKLDEYEGVTGVLDALRYDPPMGPEFVAAEVDKLVTALAEAIASPTPNPAYVDKEGDEWRDAFAILQAVMTDPPDLALRREVVDGALRDHHPGHLLLALAGIAKGAFINLGVATQKPASDWLSDLARRMQGRMDGGADDSD